MIKIIKLTCFLLFCIQGIAIAQQVSKDYLQNNLTERKQIEQNIVLLKNEANLIPIQHLEKTNIAIINNSNSPDYFGKMLDKYDNITHLNYNKTITKKKLDTYNIVIFPLSSIEDITNLNQIKTDKNEIIITFSEEVLTAFLTTDKKYNVLIYVPNFNQISQEYAAQLIFGGILVQGKLQKAFSSSYPIDYGLRANKIRLKYTIPEEVGMDSNIIHKKIDSIMTFAIKNHAFPGAQLLVAKDDKVIFHKTYGFHTYDSIQRVQQNDLYDLASVTKILGPLPALMKLYEQGTINLDKPFSLYWLSWKSKKDKNKLTLREILAHQAGLKPYIVFLNKVMRRNGKFKKRFIRNKRSSKFSAQAYGNIFVNRRFKNKMFRIIKRSKVSDVKKYKYSGLSFLIFPSLITKLTGIPYSTYLQKEFYKPLGAYTLGFTPKTKHFKNDIVPTEKDTLFRKTLVKGWVHDENAALLGGVSGNAGLFATANDLVKLMQLYVQKGIYGGKRYLKKSTLNEFTKVQYPENGNRRGLGFDKPLLNNATLTLKDAYPAPQTSSNSFGHAGFTGTFVWADPNNQLVFIFLSNRVNPTRKNRNLYKLGIRPALQQVFYQAIDSIN